MIRPKRRAPQSKRRQYRHPADLFVAKGSYVELVDGRVIMKIPGDTARAREIAALLSGAKDVDAIAFDNRKEFALAMQGRAAEEPEDAKQVLNCNPIQHGDTTQCETCALLWDTNDPDPPRCPYDIYAEADEAPIH